MTESEPESTGVPQRLPERRREDLVPGVPRAPTFAPPDTGAYARPRIPGAHRQTPATGPIKPPRRRRSEVIGPLAGAVALAVLAGIGVYVLVAAGGGCGGEVLTLNVAAAPEITPAVGNAAERFNDAGHEVGVRCVRAQVSGTDPAALATLLSGRGVTSGVTRAPDLWIPDSSLWAAMVRGATGGKAAPQATGTSLAASPLVVAVPRAQAGALPARPGGQVTWKALLRSAAGAGAPGTARRELHVPDPDRTATGMGSLLLVNALLAADSKRKELFTGLVRSVRGNVSPSVEAQFAAVFAGRRRAALPRLALASEQAVYAHNRGGPAEPAQPIYPAEGTLALDYPVMLTSQNADAIRAAGLLRRELAGRKTRDELGRLGLRAPDGTAAFPSGSGLPAARPRLLPAPRPRDVRQVMQAWARLTLGIRMLSVIDVSGSMAEPVAPGVTRLASTLRAAQAGLSLLPDDTELGQWIFSTRLRDGGQDWRELVGVGPLGQRFGSSTRRRLILSAFAQIRPKRGGDTGLYDTVLAAFRHMKATYKPEFVNSVLLWTDGRNEDDDGPSLRATLDALRREYDPNRPVQVIMFGFGGGVDVNELRQIAQVTRGDTYVAQTPDDARTFLFKAVSRRLCAPAC